MYHIGTLRIVLSYNVQSSAIHFFNNVYFALNALFGPTNLSDLRSLMQPYTICTLHFTPYTVKNNFDGKLF